jgi:hypothetical protein
LDDAGKTLALINELVNLRYGGQGWTIITTNMPRPEFERRFGTRIASRLGEAGCGFVTLRDDFKGRTKQ